MDSRPDAQAAADPDVKQPALAIDVAIQGIRVAGGGLRQHGHGDSRRSAAAAMISLRASSPVTAWLISRSANSPYLADSSPCKVISPLKISTMAVSSAMRNPAMGAIASSRPGGMIPNVT